MSKEKQEKRNQSAPEDVADWKCWKIPKWEQTISTIHKLYNANS